MQYNQKERIVNPVAHVLHVSRCKQYLIMRGHERPKHYENHVS